MSSCAINTHEKSKWVTSYEVCECVLHVVYSAWWMLHCWVSRCLFRICLQLVDKRRNQVARQAVIQSVNQSVSHSRVCQSNSCCLCPTKGHNYRASIFASHAKYAPKCGANEMNTLNAHAHSCCHSCHSCCPLRLSPCHRCLPQLTTRRLRARFWLKPRLEDRL